MLQVTQLQTIESNGVRLRVALIDGDKLCSETESNDSDVHFALAHA